MLTLDETTNSVEARRHSYDANEGLLASTENVKHKAADDSDSKRPTVENNLNLGLLDRIFDACLIEDLRQVEPVHGYSQRRQA